MDILSRGMEQLLGRQHGPLHVRLFVMPVVVTVFAIRSGLRDAQEGNKPLLWAILSTPDRRADLLRSAVLDIGRIFIMAVVLDAVYQLAVLKAFYVVQALIIAFVCAILPYVIIRGPVTRIARLLTRKWEVHADS